MLKCLYNFLIQITDIVSVNIIVSMLPRYCVKIIFNNQHMIQNTNYSAAIFFLINVFIFKIFIDMRILILIIINRQIDCSKESPLAIENKIHVLQ